MAALEGYPMIVQILVDRGALIKTNDAELTYFDIAVKSGQKDVLKTVMTCQRLMCNSVYIPLMGDYNINISSLLDGWSFCAPNLYHSNVLYMHWYNFIRMFYW